MDSYKRSKSGGSPNDGPSNSTSPASSVALSNPGSSQGMNNNAPKYGTLVPNRIFVGGITSNTTETDLTQLFSKYGNVKATKIIADRAGVSKGYGFVTFDSEEEVKFLIQDANNIVLKERRLNIAPAIKKQPFSRPIDAPSPPPTSPNLYFHNGMPYTFHNGMAFFSPMLHQPTIAAIPPSSESTVYSSSYGPSQGTANGPYGTPVLVPAPTPMFLPQNYSYQPMPMPNGAPSPFMYSNSGSQNSSPGSPMTSGPDSAHPHLPPHVATQFYAPQQFPPQDATYYSPPVYIGYYNSSEYDSMDHQNTNDECSSVASTSCSDISEQSSRSSTTPKTRMNQSRPQMKIETSASQIHTTSKESTLSNSDSQVPVVSWQNMKMHGEERELLIRDGRRAFHPIVRPPRHTPPQVLMYQPSPFPSSSQQPNIGSFGIENSRAQRQNNRGRPIPLSSISFVPKLSLQNQITESSRGPRVRMLTSDIPPFIPKFPESFINNNNPLAMNNNLHETIPSDLTNGKPLRIQNKGIKNRGNRAVSPNSFKPSNSYPVSSPSPQVMQVMERAPITIPPQRWASNPQPPPQQIKRIISSKRQNGIPHNVGGIGIVGVSKKTAGEEEGEAVGDAGGGGDTPASEVCCKMQSLMLGNSS